MLSPCSVSCSIGCLTKSLFFPSKDVEYAALFENPGTNTPFSNSYFVNLFLNTPETLPLNLSSTRLQQKAEDLHSSRPLEASMLPYLPILMAAIQPNCRNALCHPRSSRHNGLRIRSQPLLPRSHSTFPNPHSPHALEPNSRYRHRSHDMEFTACPAEWT